jgi:hypothetical protein
MPIQMYRCRSCERLWPATDVQVAVCPHGQPLLFCPDCDSVCDPFAREDTMLDGNGLIVNEYGYPGNCDASCCINHAQYRVMVSKDRPHDGFRDYCPTCYEAYMVGVQHGRYHEAYRHRNMPGRDSSQDYPMQGGDHGQEEVDSQTGPKEDDF